MIAWFLGVGTPLSFALGFALAWAQSMAVGLLASVICAVLAMFVIALCFNILAKPALSRSVTHSTAFVTVLLALLFTFRWWLAGWPRWELSSITGAFSEAALCAAFTLALVRDQARAPFSELQECWADKHWQGELWGGALTTDQLIVELQAKGADALLAMPLAANLLAQPVAGKWSTVDVSSHWVEADSNSRWITVKLKCHERNDEGKVRCTVASVIDHWHVSPVTYQALWDHFTRVSLETENKSTAGDDAPTPIELQPALAAMQANQNAACFNLAQPHCQHPDPAVQADALRMCALSCANLKQWDLAFDHFHRLFELEGTAFNALQLATTSVMAGAVLRADAWFSKAVSLNGESHDQPPARLRTAYLSALEQAGEYEASQSHLEWLARGYMSMGVTDDHFVWVRGFPFFGEFLENSRAMLSQVMSTPDMVIWYERMGNALDEAGRIRLAAHVNGLQC